MKLLFTQDALVNAGAERSHLEILSRFSSESEVCFAYFYPKHDLKEEYKRAGIRLFFLDIPESYHFHLAIDRLVKLIRTEKPDLLVSCLWRADIITRIACLITGVPLVGTLVNDSYSPVAWTDKIGLKYKLVYWLDRLTSGIPVHWIANAHALADSHVKNLGLNREKISVVYRGRKVPSPRSVSSQTEIIENIIMACGDTGHGTLVSPIRNFISYGRLLERKGFQDAISAFSEVVKIYPDCTLTIYGEGPYRLELEKLIQILGLSHAVFLPGKIDDPINALIHGYFTLPTAPDSYRDYRLLPISIGTDNCQLIIAYCFLFPSWYEGFSGALVEAMMAGIPIIASDIPMNLEAVEENKTALVFPAQNQKIFAEKMIWAINHPEEMAEMGMNARKVAVSRFDINQIAKQYEQTLFSIHQKTNKS